MVVDVRAMKNSYIEWAPRIPESWNSKKVKYNFQNAKYIPGIKSVEYDRLALTMKGVIHRSKDDADGLQPKDFLTYQLLRKGELVFKLIDLQNVTTSRVGLAHDTGLVSPAYIILKAVGEVLPEFAEKYFLMLWHREIFNALGDNGVRSNLSASDLLNVPICYPSIAEQKAIIAFLNSKCAEIDALSADIQSEIDTLEAYKRSVITEAVTKGLDKNVPMKDSGIEWVGEIPVTWDFVRGKYHLSNKKYIPGIHADEYERLSLTLQGVLPRSKDDAEGLQPKDFYTYQLLKKGELVFKLIDLQNVSTSRVGLSHDTGLVSPAYIVLHGDNEVLTEYLQYFYLMMWHRQIFNALGDNGVRSNLNATDLLNVKIPVPPLDEQKRIAGFLNAKCAEIESVIAQKQEQLAVLAEYKKSVIYEYVTGKKEVPVA